MLIGRINQSVDTSQMKLECLLNMTTLKHKGGVWVMFWMILLTSKTVSRTVVIGVQLKSGRSTLARTFLLTVRLRNVGGGAGGAGTAGTPSAR